MLVQRDDNPKNIYHHCHLAFVHCYIYTVCIMCNNIYIMHSELIKICCSFPQRIFEMQFFSETFKMDFRLSTSLKCFAVSGFHPSPVKHNAEDLLQNSALQLLLSPASWALSLGSDTHPKTKTKSRVPEEQCGGSKVTANLKLPCHRPDGGQQGGSACNVTVVCVV